MNQDDARDPTYVMGRSEDEARRLEERAEFFARPTRLLFEDAGITTGMKVLDIGSGPGDVALLAAELVGPTGRVVGVDMNPAVAAGARARAQAAGMTHVSFIAGDIREVEVEHDFDAVVGRLVLMYSADPAATLRAALRAVRDDGLAAFYEMNMCGAVVSEPSSPLHQLLGGWVSETCARGGVELAMGTKLHQVFLAAGPGSAADVHRCADRRRARLGGAVRVGVRRESAAEHHAADPAVRRRNRGRDRDRDIRPALPGGGARSRKRHPVAHLRGRLGPKAAVLLADMKDSANAEPHPVSHPPLRRVPREEGELGGAHSRDARKRRTAPGLRASGRRPSGDLLAGTSKPSCSSRWRRA
jgi:SAM-dependent methyltransferase